MFTLKELGLTDWEIGKVMESQCTGTEMIFSSGFSETEALEKMQEEIEKWKREHPYHIKSHTRPICRFVRKLRIYSCQTLLTFSWETKE